MTPNDFSITIGHLPPNGVTIAVVGELDMDTVPQLEATLEAATAVGGPVEVDLSAVSFINSTGLHALLDADHTLTGLGRRLVLAGRSSVVRRLLELSGLTDHFPTRPTTSVMTGVTSDVPGRLQQLIGDLAATLLTATSLRADLTHLIAFSCQTLPGCDAASVALLVDGEPTTIEVSDHLAFEIDLVQYDTGQGPCLDALDGNTVRVEVLDSDQRFAHFARRATNDGIHSVLSMPVTHRGAVIGTLNFYARQPNAFGAAAEHIAGIAATQAAHAVARAEVLTEAAARRDQLQAHYEQMALTARAQGFLMEAQRCSAEQAHYLLQHAVDTTGDTLITVAQRILDTARSSN